MRTANQVRVRYRTGPVPDLLLAAKDGFGVVARVRVPATDRCLPCTSREALAAWPDTTFRRTIPSFRRSR